jgi:DNA-binding transcriptional MerR regulator
VNIKSLITEENIPQKRFFKSNELVSLLKVKPHEISYWESEFPKIKNNRHKHGQKIYEREEVLMLIAIKHLLHDKKLTIAGTKRVLAESDDLFNVSNSAYSRDNLEPSTTTIPDCSIAQYQADAMLHEASSIIDEQHSVVEQELEIKIKEENNSLETLEDKRKKEEKLLSLTKSKSALEELIISLQEYEKTRLTDRIFE